MKWPILQTKMDQRLLAWWKKEVLRVAEYEKKVFICKHEQGSILGEEQEIDERALDIVVILLVLFENFEKYVFVFMKVTTTGK